MERAGLMAIHLKKLTTILPNMCPVGFGFLPYFSNYARLPAVPHEQQMLNNIIVKTVVATTQFRLYGAIHGLGMIKEGSRNQW